MSHLPSRWRALAAAALLATLTATGTGAAAEAPAPAASEPPVVAAARAEESGLGARIGIAVIDATGRRLADYRGDEPFPLNSTFKAFACAALLGRVDGGDLTLDDTAAIRAADLVAYSPFAERRVDGPPPTLGQLCEAAVQLSDNTAANRVLDVLGGPPALTAFMRSIGDPTTRLDRREPELNEATPGDPRDTTTPRAAAGSLARVLLGDGLSPASRRVLDDWMLGNQVAGALLRKVLPPGWTIADRTGAGGHGSRSIIAKVQPPGRPALVVAIYVTGTTAPMAASDAAIARMGAALFGSLGAP